MERLTKLIITIIAIGITVEILLGPGVLIICGLALMFILWGAQGGMTEGNPYKRMRYSGMPDFLEVKDYMRKQDIETRDNADANITIFVFGVGSILIAIDILYMWSIGWI